METRADVLTCIWMEGMPLCVTSVIFPSPAYLGHGNTVRIRQFSTNNLSVPPENRQGNAFWNDTTSLSCVICAMPIKNCRRGDSTEVHYGMCAEFALSGIPGLLNRSTIAIFDDSLVATEWISFNFMSPFNVCNVSTCHITLLLPFNN